MSSFNMVAGTNKLAGMVLHALNLEHGQVPRFRDAYLDIDNPARPMLVILTRTGGGNRQGYIEDNKTLSGMDGFISDDDDSYDETFAHWRFDVPPNVEESIREVIAKVIELATDPNSGLDPEILMKPMDRFKSRLNSEDFDPGPMADQLKEAVRQAGFDGK
jgi:hypothetical protein